MFRRTRNVAAPAVVAVALILTGCSSSDGEDATSSGEEVTAEETVTDSAPEPEGEEVDFLDFDTEGSVGFTVPAGTYFVAPIPQETIDTIGWDQMGVEQKADNDLATPLPVGESAPEGAEVTGLGGDTTGLVWRAGDTPGEVTISYAYDPIGDGGGKVQASMTVTIE